MFDLIETAFAFVAAMLAASLFISALVQLIQGAGGYRASTMQEMLRTLIHGFQTFHNDEEVIAAETNEAIRTHNFQRENRFVTDILADPVLHARGLSIAYSDDKLKDLVEYIHEDDLATLVYNYAKFYKKDHSPENPAGVEAVKAATPLPLPFQWVGGDQATDTRKPYADTKNFVAYIEAWFSSIEGAASERFKARIRRLTLVTSATVVVLFSFDGIRLLEDLSRRSATRQALISQSLTLETTASRLGVSEAAPGPATEKDLALELQKTATFLDAGGLGLGWQQSWITKRWCEYRGRCPSERLPPSTVEILLETLRWLTGLMFSWLLLSLGSPFWYEAFSRFVRLKNAVQSKKESVAP
jgi:hypothetical protein